MGKIELDHTGTGSGITLSSDGTDLLLNGTAIGGGGGADLYAANESSPTAQPSATGTNAIAIGDSAVAAANDSLAIGDGATVASFANFGVAIGKGATANGSNSVSIGQGATSQLSNAVALGRAYVDAADGFAAAIANNTSSYGATGANSIAMGYLSKATSANSIAIGNQNIAQTNINSAAIGGLNNTASGNYSIIAGGNANTASGARGAVLGGQANSATGSYSAVTGGFTGTASNNYSTVAGGYFNTASGHGSFAHGMQAVATVTGQRAYASGQFAAAGDAQGGQFILRADTTDATATVLTTNNSTAASTNQIVAASDTCITFDGTITAMQNGAQAYASWKIEGLLVNDGGTTTLANSATTVISNADGWGMALSADNTNNALAITCTGEAAHNIRWVANIRTSEVTYA